MIEIAGHEKVGFLAEITNLIYDKVLLVLKKSHIGCEKQNFVASQTFLTDSESTYPPWYQEGFCSVMIRLLADNP